MGSMPSCAEKAQSSCHGIAECQGSKDTDEFSPAEQVVKLECVQPECDQPDESRRLDSRDGSQASMASYVLSLGPDAPGQDPDMTQMAEVVAEQSQVRHNESIMPSSLRPVTSERSSQVWRHPSSIMSLRNFTNEQSCQVWRNQSSLPSHRMGSEDSQGRRSIPWADVENESSQVGYCQSSLETAQAASQALSLESSIPELSEVVAVFSQVRRLSSERSAVGHSGAHYLTGSSVAEPRDSLVSMSRSERHKSGRYSLVDKEIVRGITLRKSLWRLGRLWRHNPATLPPEERAALFELSEEAASFNVFVSHTWWTSGRWKVVSLFFQCGWPQAMIFWLVAYVVSATLCMLDILPMPLLYQADILGFVADCPMGFWILASSFLATGLGFLLAPYRLNKCVKPDVCFIDVASIHQLDHKLMERGVYGIAGFLSVAEELRVLWSTPYLTRLWCIFELAAYKKVNPDGRIAFRPVFTERVAVQLLLAVYAYMCVSWFSRLGENASSLLPVRYALLTIPWALSVYWLRMSFREKYNLFAQLEAFDVDRAQCTEDFDRQFIHAAIIKWYGSKDAFNDFVRHDLRRHVEEALSKRLPVAYVLLAVTPNLSTSSEFLISIWRAGAPARCLLSVGIGVIIGLFFLWAIACLLLLVYLCDRFAARHWGRYDHLQTLLIFLVTLIILSVGAAASTVLYARTLLGSVIFALVALVFFTFILWLEESVASSILQFCRRRQVRSLDGDP